MSIIKTLSPDIISKIHEMIDDNISPDNIRTYILFTSNTLSSDEDIIDYIRNYCGKEWVAHPKKKRKKFIQNSDEKSSVPEGIYINIEEITSPTTEDAKIREDDLEESIASEKSSNGQSTENMIKNDAEPDTEKHHQNNIEESDAKNNSEKTSYEHPIDSSSCENTTPTIDACPKIDVEDLKDDDLSKENKTEQPINNLAPKDINPSTVSNTKTDIDHNTEENGLPKESCLEESNNIAIEEPTPSACRTDEILDTLKIIDYLKSIQKGIMLLDASNRNLSNRLTKLENEILKMQSNNPYVKVQKFADDLIDIYANEKSKKSVNVNPLINDRIIEAMAKKYNITNNNSLAVNTALLLALYKSGIDDMPDKINY